MLHVIEMGYDSGTQTLVLADGTLSHLSLADAGDRVQWLAKGCPNDCYLRLRFVVHGVQVAALGPFSGLRQSQSYAISDGLLGAANEVYLYRVALVRPGVSGESPDEVVAETEELTLVKEVADESTGLTILVRPDPNDARNLTVEPEDVRIYSGDSVQWVFKGMAQAPAWVPIVRFFSSPDGSRQLNRHFGPFTSICNEEDRVVATGNNRIMGDFGYVVETVDVATGKPLRSKIKDPGMGNDGDPPGGAGP